MAQERKVVTVLFCDLVGFTSRAEDMDPEDVAALLVPYQARLKEELERYGGTVEKFIGDAVMALFGAPTAHEDDPERAVRAALAIRDFARDEGIELRIGITTGEALISLEAQPEHGETMATGDVINTAARLQTAAPVNGVLVGEATFRATRTAIEYEDREPVEAEGKSRPVPVWEALSPRARITLDRLHGASLVGRAHELTLLEGALTRARQERLPQLVTLIGVPGIGKSRLVFELFQAVERDRELISWRQGRCLPYGDGVTFWALGEIVKAQAGILETDSALETEEKLKAAAEDPWIQTHLRPLVGLAAEHEGGTDGRDEAFAAWRGFLELLAGGGTARRLRASCGRARCSGPSSRPLRNVRDRPHRVRSLRRSGGGSGPRGTSDTLGRRCPCLRPGRSRARRRSLGRDWRSAPRGVRPTPGSRTLGYRRTEAGSGLQIERGLAFYRTVGGTRYLRQGEALLAAAS